MSIKTLNTILKRVRDALTSISGLQVYHYTADVNAGDPYCIWAEEGEGSSLEADDRKQARSISGSIDYYTRTEFDPVADAIENALNDAKIGFYLNSVQHEDETGYIHTEWVFNVS